MSGVVDEDCSKCGGVTFVGTGDGPLLTESEGDDDKRLTLWCSVVEFCETLLLLTTLEEGILDAVLLVGYGGKPFSAGS